MNIKTEAKFNLEDAASEVYEKAESMYKGSEITTDILDTIIDKYFSKKYSPRQLQTIKDYFKEQEEIFYSMYNDGNEITENKKVTEATDSTMDGKDITNEFQFIKAFQSNFEPIKVIKNSYDKNYYIYRADETNTNNYLDFSKSKDYIEGWLNGAIKAKNNVISSKTESLQENTQLGRIPTSELPDFCYSYNETTGEIIVIKKGVEGYYPSNITLDNTLSGDERKQQAEELIKEQNEILGVTDDQRLQMELNSMFGWEDTKMESKKLKTEVIEVEGEDISIDSIFHFPNVIEAMRETCREAIYELQNETDTPVTEDDVRAIYNFLDELQDKVDKYLEKANPDEDINESKKVESYNSDGFPNDEDLQKYFQKLGKLPDKIELDGITYDMEQYGGSGENSYVIYTDANNNDSYIKVFYSMNKVDDNSYKGVKEITGVSDLRENKKLNESTQQFIIGLTNKTVKELAEDETYDSYVEDIKDSDNIHGIEVGLTDNREEALRFDNKTDAEIAASEIEQIQDTFQTVIVIAL